MAKFPEPPNPLSTAAITKVLSARTRLWRVYFSAGAHSTTWNAFRAYGPTCARFDHHDPPPPGQAKGIVYACSEPTTCLAEVFQATRVVDRTSRAPWLVAFETVRDLTLLDLTGPWPTRAGASMAIASGPRPRARRWSRAIYAAYPAVEGLWYGSSMHANKPCVALYERASSALPTAPTFHRALVDPTLGDRISAAANTLGYLVV